MVRASALLLGLLMAACSSTGGPGARPRLPRLESARTELCEYGASDSRYQRAMDIITLVNDTALTFEYPGDDQDWPAYSCFVDSTTVASRLEQP
jgi:hypothetical protein